MICTSVFGNVAKLIRYKIKLSTYALICKMIIFYFLIEIQYLLGLPKSHFVWPEYNLSQNLFLSGYNFIFILSIFIFLFNFKFINWLMLQVGLMKLQSGTSCDIKRWQVSAASFKQFIYKLTRILDRWRHKLMRLFIVHKYNLKNFHQGLRYLNSWNEEQDIWEKRCINARIG